DGNVLFSRYLGSFDMRPVRLRAKADLKALVAIANPTEIARYQPGGRALAPIDVKAELARARGSLDSIIVVELAGRRPVSVDAIVNQLRTADCDILYLVCHGALTSEGIGLWLDLDSGNFRVTPGAELVEGLARLPRLPRLVILASCQSGGTGTEAHSED